MGRVRTTSLTGDEGYLLIKPTLDNVLVSNNADITSLNAIPMQGYTSICFKNSVLFLVHNTNEYNYFKIDKKYYRYLPPNLLPLARTTDTYSFFRFYFSSEIEVMCYKDYLATVLEKVLESFAREFDCCSRYVECSNARKCIHPDKDFALGCGYKQKLKKGDIFYGKYANI